MLEKYIKLITQAAKVEEKKYVYIELDEYLKKYESVFRDVLKDKEVYFNYKDPFKKHELLLELDQESINKHPYFNNSARNKYATLDAAFIFIESPIPELMSDVEPIKLKNTVAHVRSTEKEFRKLYEHDKLNWNISALPNKYWAEYLGITEEELLELFYKICLVDENTDPYTNWLNKTSELKKITDKLNEYYFEYLEYVNSLGTNLTVYLPNNHTWHSGLAQNGALVNLPTEEVFTSPQYNKINGIVYSSKPLLYNDVLIDNFYLKLEDGKIVDYGAEKGLDVLKNIIETDEWSCFLGECALVSFDSPINNTNLIFNETLLDENASCHLAIGKGFGECVEGANELEGDELRRVGINDSKTHVDFMIGTRDLTITGTTHEGVKVKIMENGNIVL